MTGVTDLLAGQIAPSTLIEKRQTTTIRYLRRLTEIMDIRRETSDSTDSSASNRYYIISSKNQYRRSVSES
jgi:dTDP-4-amino-4,6-dideoxygalactose transaminase